MPAAQILLGTAYIAKAYADLVIVAPGGTRDITGAIADFSTGLKTLGLTAAVAKLNAAIAEGTGTLLPPEIP